ncbi:Regulatory protein GemA [Gammaproteobacteria bacterium]
MSTKTPASDKYRRQELAKIHLAKKDLALSDDAYRAIILGASGNKSDSAATLDGIGRARALARFAELGWQAKSKKSPTRTFSRRLADDPQSRLLRGMWIELHKLGAVKDSSETALCHFVKRMTKVDALEWLSDRQVTIVKKALKDWTKRVTPEPA